MRACPAVTSDPTSVSASMTTMPGPATTWQRAARERSNSIRHVAKRRPLAGRWQLTNHARHRRQHGWAAVSASASSVGARGVFASDVSGTSSNGAANPPVLGVLGVPGSSAPKRAASPLWVARNAAALKRHLAASRPSASSGSSGVAWSEALIFLGV